MADWKGGLTILEKLTVKRLAVERQWSGLIEYVNDLVREIGKEAFNAGTLQANTGRLGRMERDLQEIKEYMFTEVDREAL